MDFLTVCRVCWQCWLRVIICVRKFQGSFFPQLSYYTFTVLIDEAGGIIFLGCCPSVYVLHAWAETFSIRFVVDFKLMM